MIRLLPLVLCALQSTPLDDFYKFKSGTIWVYKRLEDGAERKITGKVTGDENGRVQLEWNDPDKDGKSTVAWSVKDGILTAEAHKDGEGGLSFLILKADSKKDDRWASPGGEVVHQGKAEVTVPAGTYKDATWTQLKVGEDADETRIDFYLVPKVGLVKIAIHTKDSNIPNTFELTEFKAAK